MADDLFDTRDIFETAGAQLSSSPFLSPHHENIDSYDQIQRVITEFDGDSCMRQTTTKQIDSLINPSEAFLPLSEITELKKHWSQHNQQNSVKKESSRDSIKDDNLMTSFSHLSETTHQQANQFKLEKQQEMFLSNQKENIQSLPNFYVKADSCSRQTLVLSENPNSKENNINQKHIIENIKLEQREQTETHFESASSFSGNQLTAITTTIQPTVGLQNNLCSKIDEISQNSQLDSKNAESQFDFRPKNDSTKEHNEMKNLESENQEGTKQPDAWELRLNEFYNRLFSQASIALLIPDQPNILGKTSKMKPQSLHRLAVKQSVSKPTLQPNIIKRPGTVTKFNVPSMMTRNIKPVPSVETTSNSVYSRGQIKSFSVAKFNTKPLTTPSSFGSGILKNSKSIKKEIVTPKVIQTKVDTNRNNSKSQNNQSSHQNLKDNKNAFFNK